MKRLTFVALLAAVAIGLPASGAKELADGLEKFLGKRLGIVAENDAREGRAACGAKTQRK